MESILTNGVAHELRASFDKFMDETVPDTIREYNHITANEHDLVLSNVFYTLPSVKEANGEVHFVTPQECRIRGLTYAVNVFVDVHFQGDLYREVFYCSIPVMVQSKYCHRIREDEYDDGGYFIIEGQEKIILTQQRLRQNVPHVWKSKNVKKYDYQLEYRSCHELKLRSSSTLKIFLKEKPKPTKKNRRQGPYLFVRLPFINLDVPLNELLTFYFGIEDPKWLETLGRKTSLDEMTREKCIQAARNILTQEVFPHLGLEKLNPEKSYRELQRLRYNEFQRCANLLVTHQVTDRDDIAMNRFEKPGRLLGLLFRQLVISATKTATQYLFKTSKRPNISSVVEMTSITKGLRYAIGTGNWGTKKDTARQSGVAQTMNHKNPYAYYSQLKKVNKAIHKQGKQTDPRKLNRSATGILCPNHTPDSEECGLVTNLTQVTHIRDGFPSALITGLLSSLLTGGDLANQVSERAEIRVDGVPVGSTPDAHQFIERFREFRRLGNIPYDASISYTPGEIHIGTDEGCASRPLQNLLVSNGDPASSIEYISKEEESLYAVAETLSQVQEKTTHLALDPTYLLSIAGGISPLSNHNPGPRNLFFCGALSQCVTAFGPERRLWYVQKPLVNTLTSRQLRLDENPPGVNVIVAIINDPYNQNDAIVFNQSAIDRGLFRSSFIKTSREQSNGEYQDEIHSSSLSGEPIVITKTWETRAPQIGDKFTSRHGQKGVIGMTYRQEDLPFTAEGMVPDVLINSACIPSRMTVGQLLEMFLGKQAAKEGEIKDGTSFRPPPEDAHAKEVMYNAQTGKRLDALIYIGPAMYLRQTHDVADKLHARDSDGPKIYMTRQPVEGRSRKGAQRWGNMEQQTLVSHGAAAMMRDRTCTNSDEFIMYICNQCGFRTQRSNCQRCRTNSFIKPITVPFSWNLLVQELEAVHIQAKYVLRLKDDAD